MTEEEKIQNSIEIIFNHIFTCEHGIHFSSKKSCEKCYINYIEKLRKKYMIEKVYIVIPSSEKEEMRAYSEEIEALRYLNSILIRYAEISGYIQELEVNKKCL